MCSNPNYKHVVCFTIQRPARNPYLSALQERLADPDIDKNQYSKHEQINKASILEKGMAFYDFFQASKSVTTTTFVISDDEANSNYATGSIYLYSQGKSEEFMPPCNPPRPEVSNITHNSITLTWDKPKDGYQNITEYEILINPNSEHQVRKGAKYENIVINDLQPATKYQFQVRACSIPGMSKPSDITDVSVTLPTSPPGKPTASVTSTTTVKLEWDKPTVTGHVSIERYIIAANLKNVWEEFEPVSGEKTSAEVSLNPAERYRFNVIADCGENGKSLPSPLSDVCEMLKVDNAQPLSKPGKPSITSITHNSMTLTWDQPEYGSSYITQYEVFVRENSVSTHREETGNKNVTYEKRNLKPGTEYDFQIMAHSGHRRELSDVTAPIRTLPTSPPGKPVASKVSVITANLEWDEPLVVGKDVIISSYKVQVQVYDRTETYKVPGNEKSTKIDIKPNTKYKFEVTAECSELGESLSSPVSDEFCVTADQTDIVKAEILKNKSDLIEKGTPSIFQLQTLHTHILDKLNIKKCEFGEENSAAIEKVILIMGPVGSGKSTLINGMVNYILGVEWEDDFRFKLICEEVNQAEQRSDITAYKIHRRDGFRINYTLTIIDTPGFGDIASIMRDKEISEQIMTFFTTPGDGGIDHIDAVGFVVQSGLRHLTQTQKYIFDNFLALFEGNISESIFALVTFADGQKPPALDALQEAKLPYKEYFKFNNSALFAENGNTSNDSCNFDELFWKMGTQSCKLFISDHLVESKTLVFTKDVSNEDHQMEVYVEGIQTVIQKGLKTLEELKVEVEIVKAHEAEINKNFANTVYQDQGDKAGIPPHGRAQVTTCLTCNRTCYYHPCGIPDDDQKVYSCILDENDKCIVCKVKHNETVNENYRYKFVTTSQKVENTTAVQGRYDDAIRKTFLATELAQKVSKTFEKIKMEVIGHAEILNLTKPYKFRVIAGCGKHGKSLSGTLSGKGFIKLKSFKMVKNINYVQLPFKPSNLTITDATHDSMTLQWKKPETASSYITQYEILFRESGALAKNETTGNENMTYKVRNLMPGTKYEFQVRAHLVAGMSKFSDVLELLQTRPTSPPGKPEAWKTSAITAHLKWDKPKAIGEKVVISSYRVQAHSEGKKKFETVETSNTSTLIRIKPNKCYKFSIIADCKEFGESLPSKESDTFFTSASDTEITLAEILLDESTKIKTGEPAIYKLQKDEKIVNQTENLKCEFGQRKVGVPEKVIMIVGATGSGKSTMINGMINYILGVEWKDKFRFKLIVEPDIYQGKSVTSSITAYTIHHREGYKIPYTLTIIDTPGFGDPAGIKRDKEITEQIRTFFSTPGDGGIDHIDAVAFVVQSSLPRLTPTQKYIFDSILALFGKDLSDNIFMLLTFADGQKPQVLDGLKEAQLPFSKYFKFNNSALFAKNTLEYDFDKMFWSMGTKNFQIFVGDCLGKAKSKSLSLTKDVLKERHQIDVYVEGIQTAIQKGLDKLERLKKEVQILKAEKDKSKDYTYSVNYYEKKISTSQFIDKLLAEFKQIQVEVNGYTESVRLSLKRLYEIELKRPPLSTTEYIDILIKSQNAEAKPRWKERVKQLREVRRQAECIQEIAYERYDPFEQYKEVLTEATEAKTSGELNTTMMRRYPDPRNWFK